MCYSGMCKFEMTGNGMDGECDYYRLKKEQNGICPGYVEYLLTEENKVVLEEVVKDLIKL